MKLEVGQFVRFKDKRNITYIRKIREIPQDNRYASIYLDKEANYSKGLSLKNIIKASYNIIDLIEVGDYVNGEIVIGFGTFYYDDGTIERTSLTLDRTVTCLNSEIKSIVTHEQMEQMSYKIKE